MSEHEEPRRLTRRELRLREMAAASAPEAEESEPAGAQQNPAEGAGGLNDEPADRGGSHRSASAESTHTGSHGIIPPEQPPAVDDAPAADAPAAAPAGSAPDDDIEVPLLDENGRPRSRRELRELRQRLLEQRAAAARASAPESDEVEDRADADSEAPEPATAQSAAPEPADPDAVPAAPESTEAAPEAELSDPEAELSDPVTTDAEPAAPADAVDAPADDPPASDEASFTELIEIGAERASTEDVSTQAYSIDELREAESGPVDDEAQTPGEPESEGEPEETEQKEPAKRRLRVPWRRSRAESTVESAEVPIEEGPTETEAQAGAALEPGAAPEAPSEPEPEPATAEPVTVEAEIVEAPPGEGADADETAPEAETEPSTLEATVVSADPASGVEEAVVEADPERGSLDPERGASAPGEQPEPDATEPDAAEAGAAEPDSAEAEAPDEGARPVSARKGGYSFPDIVPPEEWRSVFDDPRTRIEPDAPQSGSAEKGDFDDLISRAVAQEGSAGTSTSALILPEMPEDAVGGPLGESGELYITGSIDVPKSIGETGGHAALHESAELDASEEPDLHTQYTPQDDSGPVSARRAVSARAPGTGPAMGDEDRKSRLPIVLAITGGVLVVGAGGFVAWAMATGLFG